jgi:serine protease Do
MKNKKSFVLIFGLTFLLLLNSLCFSEPAEKKDVETLRNTGEVFAEIAAKVTPAVVFVSVEQEIVRQMPDIYFGDPFDQFNDEFFKRFFGQPIPRQPRQQPRQQKQILKGQGSGFIITSDGYILTNNHVVESAQKITVKLSDDREMSAKVIGTDPDTDVAVIKVDVNDLPTVQLGDSDKLKVGEWVLAIGNPFGLSHTVTAGIVSAKGRSSLNFADAKVEYQDFIQTDAAINLGNSGGPLLNIDGKVVGMNSAILGSGGGYMGYMGSMGIGFAIPINMVKYVYEEIKTKGKVTRGYIGIYAEDVSPEMAEHFGVKNRKGILVDKVIENSPAGKSGIEKGDIIVKMDGNMVGEWNNFRNEIARKSPGTEIKLTVIRNGEEKDFEIKLEARESKAVSAEAGDKKMKQLGLAVQDLTPELAQQFGYANEKSGVIVTDVDPASPAADIGITQGTLITEVNRQKVENTQDFWNLVKKAEGSVLLYVKQNTDRGEISRYVVVKFNE